MTHVRPVSGERKRFEDRLEVPRQDSVVSAGPVLADAKTDLLNSVYRAWSDYTYAKKNTMTG